MDYDLHLSAYRIEALTIKRLEALGFARDTFANNRRCDTTQYHATYRGIKTLPSQPLWNEIAQILQLDHHFIGGVEEEEYSADDVWKFSGAALSTRFRSKLPSLKLELLPAGKSKACDVHLNVNLTRSPGESCAIIEQLQLPSFDKITNGELRRVYTGTFCSVQLGEQFANTLLAVVESAGIVGKLKLERTRRTLRIPDDAPTLPLISTPSAEGLFECVRSASA
jgi:hypothetical protein